MLQAWVSSNGNCLDPSQEQLATLAEQAGLLKVDLSDWFNKARRLQPTSPQSPSEQQPQLKRRRITQGSENKDALEGWVLDHDGRLWQTRQERDIFLKQTGCSEAQVTNWFAYRRKKAKVELETALDDSRGFIAQYGYEVEEDLTDIFSSSPMRKYVSEGEKTLDLAWGAYRSPCKMG